LGGRVPPVSRTFYAKVRTSNDQRSRGDDFGEAGLDSDTAHRAPVEVWLWVVSDVGQPGDAAVMYRRTGTEQ